MLDDGEICWCNVAANQFANETWVLSATVLLVSWIFLESSVLLTQVFFKMPFYGIPWGCTHVLCGSPTVSRRWSMWAWRLCLSTVAIGTWLSVQHEAVVVNKVTTNCTTGTPILHVEALFNPAERGLRRRSRAEPLSNVTFILASFQSLQFSFANNSKGL